jgi:hypothetical protein
MCLITAQSPSSRLNMHYIPNNSKPQNGQVGCIKADGRMTSVTTERMPMVWLQDHRAAVRKGFPTTKSDRDNVTPDAVCGFPFMAEPSGCYSTRAKILCIVYSIFPRCYLRYPSWHTRLCTYLRSASIAYVCNDSKQPPTLDVNVAYGDVQLSMGGRPPIKTPSKIQNLVTLDMPLLLYIIWYFLGCIHRKYLSMILT